MPRIVVIGGGTSGLACARAILDRMPAASVTVLEAGTRPGGPLCTVSADGFLCEAGPHGFVDSDPATVALAQRLGLGDRLLPADEAHRGRFIFHGGRLHRFPDGPRRVFSSDLLGWWGRARLLAEPLLPAGAASEDESVGAFARRRLGNEVATRLVDPLVCGIYGGDMDQLSLTAMAPQLLFMLRGRASSSSPAGGEKAGAGAGAPPKRRLVSFVGGMGELVQALSASLGESLECGRLVTAISHAGDRWKVVIGGAQPMELSADAVVSALPAPTAASLFGSLDAELAASLASIRYLPDVVVALGFHRAEVGHPLDGFGYLVPRGANAGSVLGVLWSSSMFPGKRSPEGTVLVQAILGGSRRPDICEQSDAALEEQVCAQLRQAIDLRGAPIVRRTWRHRPGLPQYEVGHHQRVARVENAEARLPGLFITGNALRGVGINACTADANRVAARVADHVERLR